MISGFGWAALALLFGYLALFFWGIDSILGWLTKLILGGPDAGV